VPIYTYRCRACSGRFDVLVRNTPEPERCRLCGDAAIERTVASFAIARSDLEQLRQLDPKYRHMVDDLMANTPEAEPMRHIERLTPFSAASDPGDPIEF